MTHTRHINVIFSSPDEDRELNDSLNERYFYALQKSYSWSIRKKMIFRGQKCIFAKFIFGLENAHFNVKIHILPFLTPKYYFFLMDQLELF